MRYKILYLPTAEEVIMPGEFQAFDRAWYENYIKNNHALYGKNGVFYPVEYTHYHYDIFDVVPKHLLAVAEEP